MSYKSFVGAVIGAIPQDGFHLIAAAKGMADAGNLHLETYLTGIQGQLSRLFGGAAVRDGVLTRPEALDRLVALGKRLPDHPDTRSALHVITTSGELPLALPIESLHALAKVDAHAAQFFIAHKGGIKAVINEFNAVGGVRTDADNTASYHAGRKLAGNHLPGDLSDFLYYAENHVARPQAAPAASTGGDNHFILGEVFADPNTTEIDVKKAIGFALMRFIPQGAMVPTTVLDALTDQLAKKLPDALTQAMGPEGAALTQTLEDGKVTPLEAAQILASIGRATYGATVTPKDETLALTTLLAHRIGITDADTIKNLALFEDGTHATIHGSLALQNGLQKLMEKPPAHVTAPAPDDRSAPGKLLIERFPNPVA